MANGTEKNLDSDLHFLRRIHQNLLHDHGLSGGIGDGGCSQNNWKTGTQNDQRRPKDHGISWNEAKEKCMCYLIPTSASNNLADCTRNGRTLCRIVFQRTHFLELIEKLAASDLFSRRHLSCSLIDDQNSLFVFVSSNNLSKECVIGHAFN